MNLNLACGDTRLGDALGVDIYDTPTTDLRADIMHLPFGNQTIDSIQCHQAVEHFFPDETQPLFEEWARVLKSNGTIYITTPDFRYVSQQYLNHGMALQLVRAYVCGTTDLNTFTKDQPESYHRTLWDQDTLMSELKIWNFERFNVWNEEWNLHLTAHRR